MKAFCERPFSKLKIDADGKYQSCCHQTIYYGNLIEDKISLEEAFKNSMLREVKNSVLGNKLHPGCKSTTCPIGFKGIDRILDVRLSKYPEHIELALPSTWCNIGGLKPTSKTACMMCPRSSVEFMEPYSKHIDNTDKLIEIIKPAVPYLNSFSLLGISEPFWKGRIFEVFDKMDFKRYKEQMIFWTYSNGIVFDDKAQDRFLDEYTKWTHVGFSIDAASRETFKKIHRLDKYSTVIKNLERYFNRTSEFKTKRDWSFMTANINLLNLHEMEEMVRTSKNIGANKIQFNLTYSFSFETAMHKNLLCNKTNWKQFWEAQLRATQVAKEIGQTIEFYRPFHLGYIK